MTRFLIDADGVIGYLKGFQPTVAFIQRLSSRAISASLPRPHNNRTHFITIYMMSSAVPPRNASGTRLGAVPVSVVMMSGEVLAVPGRATNIKT